MIEKGIEIKRDVVIVKRLVSVNTIGAHDAWVAVMCVHGYVQILAVIGDPNVGIFCRRRSFNWVLLDKLSDVNRILPNDVIVEPSLM